MRVSGRWLLIPAGLTLLVLAGFAVFYVLCVHPDDARVTPAAPAGSVIGGPGRERAGSLLSSGWPHRLSVPDEHFDRAMRALDRPGMISLSRRFVSRYQVFLPVGRYPARLDARDGILIPAGGTLEIEPSWSGDGELHLGMYGFEHRAELRVVAGSGAQAPDLLTYEPPAPPPDTNSWWYRRVGRYLDVDPQATLPVWAEGRYPVRLPPGGSLTLECVTAGPGCAVSDPAIFVPAPAAADNVLIIMVDTMRHDALAAGHAPTLSALADESVVFANALAAGNMTSPSTNAFLSCLKPSTMGKVAFAYTLSPEKREAWYAQRRPSFPARFSRAGFDTAMLGNVSVISEVYGVGVHHGFMRQVALETDGFDTAQTAREAVRWLRANSDHRFMLYLHFNGPHAPYRAPIRDLRRTWPGWRTLRSYPDILHWIYQSEISYTDRYVALVLDELKALGLYDRTRIVVSADHGDQHRPRRFAGNTTGREFVGSYFDHGATLYNDEIKVPLMIRIPGVPPRRVATGWVSALDVGPTLLDLAGLEGAAGCGGASLGRKIKDDAGVGNADSDREIGSEAFQGRAIVFGGRWKYIRTYNPTDKRVYSPGEWTGRMRQFMVPEQIFDLESDPDETVDLSRSRPELLAEARARFRRYYDLAERYQLVVESGQKGEIVAVLGGAIGVRLIEGAGKIEEDAGEITVRGIGPGRLIVVADQPPPGGESVMFNGTPLPVRSSSMRLSGELKFEDLPLEPMGRYGLLEPLTRPNAYRVRVEDDGREDRSMVIGNPAFDQVLREWGYLND